MIPAPVPGPPSPRLATGEAERTEQLRRRFLDAATELLVERGYDGMTTEAIAERAGGSKATLYRLFESKEEILEAIVVRIRDQFLPAAEAVPAGADPKHYLENFARLAAQAVLSERSLAIHRAIAARVPQQPALGDAFWRGGPERAHEQVAQVLAEFHARGLIACPDPLRGAHAFLNLLLKGPLFEHLVGARPVPIGPDLEEHARRAVDIFLDGVRRAG